MQDQATKLRRLVSRIASVEGGKTRTRQIVLSGCKGGVGTTTVAINLAIGLRKFASRVLLVDANPARGDIASMCRITAAQDIEDVLAGRALLNQVIVTGPAGIQIAPRFGLLSSPPGATSRQLIRGLDSLMQAFDFVVIDAGSCPSTAKSLSWVADQAVVVTNTNAVAVADAYALMKSMTCMYHHVSLGCIVNSFEDHKLAEDVAGRLVESCSRFLGLRLLDLGSVPSDYRVARAVAQGRMVVCASPDAPSSIALQQIAHRLASQAGDLNARMSDGTTKENEKLGNSDSNNTDNVPILG